jgi:hypothetical protein
LNKSCLKGLTSKSHRLLITNKTATPKKKQVIRFLESDMEVTNGTDPICQSWDKVAGHSRSHQLKAAK